MLLKSAEVFGGSQRTSPSMSHPRDSDPSSRNWTRIFALFVDHKIRPPLPAKCEEIGQSRGPEDLGEHANRPLSPRLRNCFRPTPNAFLRHRSTAHAGSDRLKSSADYQRMHIGMRRYPNPMTSIAQRLTKPKQRNHMPHRRRRRQQHSHRSLQPGCNAAQYEPSAADADVRAAGVTTGYRCTRRPGP